MAVAKIWNGVSSAWEVFIMKTYNGTGWEDKANFWDGTAMVPLYPEIDIVGGSFSFASSSNPCTDGYRIGSVSEQEVEDGVAQTPFNTWRVAGSASDYDCRMTQTSGTFSGAALGTWLNMGSGPYTWTVSDSTLIGGPVTGSGTLEIRDASTLVVLDSATVSLSAERIS